MKKGQIFSADLIFASSAFLIVIFLSIWSTTYINQKTNLIDVRNDLDLISENAMSSLVETPGNPDNWETIAFNDFNQSNIFSLGLAKSNTQGNSQNKGNSFGILNQNYLVLDWNKIETLSTFNSEKYEVYKTLLGILGPNYEFYLSINMWNGTDYEMIHEIGEIVNPNCFTYIKKRPIRFIE
jgi:hypothetical protein